MGHTPNIPIIGSWVGSQGDSGPYNSCCPWHMQNLLKWGESFTLKWVCLSVTFQAIEQLSVTDIKLPELSEIYYISY